MSDSMISPGIYTKIIDLSEYLTSTSGTIGFVPVITEKGPDNVLTRVTSYQDYIDKFGEPDIRTFGKYYGFGPYVATQHLSVSSDLYVVRALPDDATYSHTYIYFSEVDDFPRIYKFAKQYEDIICDASFGEPVPLYNLDPAKAEDAVKAEVAYDFEYHPVNKVEAALYTSDTQFAIADDGTALYLVEDGTVAEGTEATETDKRVAAIEAGAAYDNDRTLIVVGEDGDAESLKGNVVYTSDTQYAVAGSKVVAFVKGTETYNKVADRIAELEPTSSSGDFNAGIKKIQGDWYEGKHTSLSAVSIIPDMLYAVQSDVVCDKQATANISTVYKIDPAKIDAAVARRCAFMADSENEKVGILATNAADATWTYRTEFAAEAVEEGDNVVDGVTLIVPKYDVDKEPWYIIDDAKRSDAIANYDAFDKNGFLTNNSLEAVYCGSPSYAAKADGELKKQNAVALRKPLTTRFKVEGTNFLYVMDRKAKDFEVKATRAIKMCAAWDASGYPALSTDQVYVTSIKEYAVMAKTPKMSTTQLLESLFHGNDTITLAAIENINGNPIYNNNNRTASSCIAGYVRAVGRGNYYNSYSIKIVSDANPSSFGTYKFQIFELQDGADVLCESYNVSFDPTALDSDGESMYWVDVINKFSERVVIEANDNAVDLFQQEIKNFYLNDPTIADVAEGLTYTYTEVVDGKNMSWEIPLTGNFPTVVPEFITDETSEDFDKIINADLDVIKQQMVDDMKAFAETEAEKAAARAFEANGFGYKARAIWEAYYAKAWAQKATYDANVKYNAALEIADDDPVKDKTFEIEMAIDAMDIAQQMTSDAESMLAWSGTRNLMNMNDSDPVMAGEQNYYLENGSLGSLINNKGLVNPQIGDQILCFAYTGLLKNPVVVKNVDESTGSIKYKQQYTDNVYDLDWIYFTIVYDAGYKPDVKQAALDLVDTYRRDCVLISDCGDNADYEDCLKYVGYVKGAADARIWNTYLAARYEPYSRVYDKFTAKDIWVSPVYHMAKLIPQTDALYNLWNASAGFNRGVCSDIKELRYSANKAQRDMLYQAQVNPIVHFPEGMTVWGQLTTQKKASSLSDLNVVRTVLYIKRAIEQYCQNYIFESNDASTWQSIQSGIQPMLDTIVANGGLKSYSLEVSATDYELKTKTCHVNVTLEPMKVLEKIQLNLYIK